MMNFATGGATGRSSKGFAQPALITIAALAFVLSGCDASPPPNLALINEADNGDAERAAALLAAQQGCMTTALNNTILKQQSDDALEAALARQDLGACPTDFVQAFVRMRNAARGYLQVSSEVLSHKQRENSAYQADGINLLCSLIAGAQCADSSIYEWQEADGALKRRIGEAKTTLDGARAEIETVSAGYSVYVRTTDQPASAVQPFNDIMPDANTI